MTSSDTLLRSLKGTVVILDLDGTLADTARDLSGALNRVLEEEGLPPAPFDAIRGAVGQGARVSLTEAYRLAGRVFPDGDRGEGLITRYVEIYRDALCQETVLFEGVADLMSWVTRVGGTLAICTNKREELALPLLDQLSVKDAFAEIICRDSLPEYKPSPLPLTTILARCCADSGVMIGDTHTDLAAANAAGLPCLIFDGGYGSVEPRDLSAADAIFEAFAEVPALISQQAGDASR